MISIQREPKCTELPLEVSTHPAAVPAVCLHPRREWVRVIFGQAKQRFWKCGVCGDLVQEIAR